MEHGQGSLQISPHFLVVHECQFCKEVNISYVPCCNGKTPMILEKLPTGLVIENGILLKNEGDLFL